MQRPERNDRAILYTLVASAPRRYRYMHTPPRSHGAFTQVLDPRIRLHFEYFQSILENLSRGDRLADAQNRADRRSDACRKVATRPSMFCLGPGTFPNSHVPSSHSCDPVRCCRLACLQAIQKNTASPPPIRASLPSTSASTTIYPPSLQAASASVTSVRVQPLRVRRSVSAGFFGVMQTSELEQS